jgi:glycosyltransferase involved in cell wall biosynthesis
LNGTATKRKSINMQPKLTVAIPTYNRAAKLRSQLASIAAQLTDEVQCCVFDNASTDETPQIVEDIKDPRISYFHAAYNAGVVGNILRCFEHCSTEWLWILSDDDPIVPRAIEQLLSQIKNSPFDFIHTSTHLCSYRTDIVVSDPRVLLEWSTLPSLVWVSTGIYRTSAFHPLLWLLVSSASTWAPHTVAVLRLLESKQSKMLLSSVELISQPPGIARWPTLDFISGFSRLPEYLTDAANQRLAAQRIWTETVYWALLMGLRETIRKDQVRKWKRTRSIVKKTLKSYGARSPLFSCVKNSLRSGERRRSLRAFHSAIVLFVLSCWPSRFFLRSLKFLPLPKWVRADLLYENKNYQPLY